MGCVAVSGILHIPPLYKYHCNYVNGRSFQEFLLILGGFILFWIYCRISSFITVCLVMVTGILGLCQQLELSADLALRCGTIGSIRKCTVNRTRHAMMVWPHPRWWKNLFVVALMNFDFALLLCICWIICSWARMCMEAMQLWVDRLKWMLVLLHFESAPHKQFCTLSEWNTKEVWVPGDPCFQDVVCRLRTSPNTGTGACFWKLLAQPGKV